MGPCPPPCVRPSAGGGLDHHGDHPHGVAVHVDQDAVGPHGLDRLGESHSPGDGRSRGDDRPPSAFSVVLTMSPASAATWASTPRLVLLLFGVVARGLRFVIPMLSGVRASTASPHGRGTSARTRSGLCHVAALVEILDRLPHPSCWKGMAGAFVPPGEAARPLRLRAGAYRCSGRRPG